MAASHRTQKKWVENFARSPLVGKASRSFDKNVARQLFYGKTNPDYPDTYPAGFQQFYNSSYALERDEAVETSIRYLHFIGIRLRLEAVHLHLTSYPEDFHVFLRKVFFILRTLAHHDALNVDNPYYDNLGDIDFLIRIETGQAQLSIFEMDLPNLYNKYVKIPDGYERDETVGKLFDRIENTNDSFFISGKAGTGKSTFVQYFAQTSKKAILLTAFTGIAAINVGGVTVHSFFRFPLRPLLPEDEEIKVFGENDQRRKVISEIDTIIIDEISMLRADTLQAIDYSLRRNGGDSTKLFGGKQILFVGDIFQLPPVTDEADDVEQFLFKELYNSPYFFDSDAYREMNPHYFEFTTSHRQKEDLEFVELLDKVRRCDVDEEALTKINSRFDPGFIPKREDFTIILTTNNFIANVENNNRLLELGSSKYEFAADVKGDYEDSKAPTNHLLELKKDAQVIFIRNDSTGLRRWVNGTIAKIEFIANDIVEVRLPDGSTHKLEKDTWEHRGYKYDRAKGKVMSEVKGTFVQYPIKLAWAITIHKSQGLTFDNVTIDLGAINSSLMPKGPLMKRNWIKKRSRP